MKSRETIRVGAGAGTSDDRMVPALELAERGDIDYLVFECLAERTVSRENLARSKDPELGYSPSLHARLRMVLPTCMRKGIRIVSNMGAANPLGGARAARKEAADLGLGDVPVAVVLGDDVSSIVKHRGELTLIENGEPLESILPKMISANAYLGADVVCEALNTGAPIVLSGRVADPSLFLAPMLHEFGWSLRRSAEDRAGDRGRPPARVHGIRHRRLLRLARKKGRARSRPQRLSLRRRQSRRRHRDRQDAGHRRPARCHDLHRAIDLRDPRSHGLHHAGLRARHHRHRADPGRADRVRVAGAKARPRTATYKVNVGYADGYIGEGEVSYGGIDAVARAKWAAEIVKERLKLQGFVYDDFRVDLIGMSSLHDQVDIRPEPYEVRLRMAGRTRERRAAHAIGFEVRAMHMHGPGGAGGACEPRVRDVLAVKSVLLPKNLVNAQVVVEGAL